MGYPIVVFYLVGNDPDTETGHKMTNEKFLLSLDPVMVPEFLEEFRPLSESELVSRFETLQNDWKDDGGSPLSSVFLVLLVCDHVLGERQQGMV